MKDIMHVAKYLSPQKGQTWLYLKKIDPRTYTWFEEETATEVTADTIEEALRLAFRQWKGQSFRTLMCGFRYTLPERDEHGINALFWQMVLSYSSSNGIYFDEEIGCNCFVQSASQEARNLWKELSSEPQRT